MIARDRFEVLVQYIKNKWRKQIKRTSLYIHTCLTESENITSQHRTLRNPKENKKAKTEVNHIRPNEEWT